MSSAPPVVTSDALHDLCLRADAPALDELAAQIVADDDLPGVPSRDVLSRIISGRELPAMQQDAVAVATVLGRVTGQNTAAVANRIRDLWVAARSSPASAAVRVGRSIRDCGPLALEVYRAIVTGNHSVPPDLPHYVVREPDDRLREVVDHVAQRPLSWRLAASAVKAAMMRISRVRRMARRRRGTGVGWFVGSGVVIGFTPPGPGRRPARRPVWAYGAPGSRRGRRRPSRPSR
jgi:hypothetical protein